MGEGSGGKEEGKGVQTLPSGRGREGPAPGGSLAKFSLGPPEDGGAKRGREGVSEGLEYPLDPGGRGPREKAVSLKEIILLGRRIRNTTQVSKCSGGHAIIQSFLLNFGGCV